MNLYGVLFIYLVCQQTMSIYSEGKVSLPAINLFPAALTLSRVLHAVLTLVPAWSLVHLR